MSQLVAHARIFRYLMKGKVDVYVQYPKQNIIKFSQQPCWVGAKFKFHYNYLIVTWRVTSTAHWTLHFCKQFKYINMKLVSNEFISERIILLPKVHFCWKIYLYRKVTGLIWKISCNFEVWKKRMQYSEKCKNFNCITMTFLLVQKFKK